MMIQRRSKSGEIATKIGNHTFRATGVTAYLKNGGTLEKAAQMANHASTRTTQLYDRRAEEVKWTPFVGPRTVHIKVESRLLSCLHSSSSKTL